MEDNILTIVSSSEFFQNVRTYLTPTQISLVQKAYDIAFDAHKDQKRKSGDPYIIHPLGVANILASMQLDVETLAAALLHDVVEDTRYTREDIARLCGETVATLVDGVTKLDKIEYISKEEQQVENYRKMFLAMSKDIRVVLIKLADRLHNMRTMAFMPEHKQRSISRETLEIYAPLAHRLGIYKIKAELEDLSFRYLEPEQYEKLREQMSASTKEREEIIRKATEELKAHLATLGVHFEIQGRPKTLYSIHRKMLKHHKELSEIYDSLAIRVLVDTVKDCYGVLGLVHGMWKPLPGRFKDYVAVPKSNMYQSLHTTIVFTGGHPLEIQIRTFEMHRISEYGIAAHWRYKEAGSGKAGTDKDFEAKLSWLRQLLEWHQDMRDPFEFVDSVKMEMFADEVFVFTPRGDVIDLPSGAVPIDFAYRIHSGVGDSCVGAKVNGRIVPLDYKLKNGDIVEVITSKQASGPSRDWLNIVAASETKNKIRQWFKRERKEENILKGKEMLEKECRRLGYETKELLTAENLKEILMRVHSEGEEQFYAALGYGGLALGTVMTKLVELYKKAQMRDTTKDIAQILSELKPRTSKAKSSHGILVKGEEGILVKLSRCCNPIPGDAIVGYITRGSGISVHRTDCPNVLSNKEENQRLIEVSWNFTTDTVYKVSLVIQCTNKTGLLSDIMMITSESKININAVNATTRKDESATIILGLDVASHEQLEYIISRIKRVKGITSVERLMTALGEKQGARRKERG